ncbi:hypothetical protein CLI69_06565 [Prevotella intermedia]|nr:hypothetical protein CLI69_06565 [Prevotella intermedia]
MQTVPFHAHYQSVYTSFDFSSFSRISCAVKAALLHRKTYAFATSNRNYRVLSELSLQNRIENLSSAWWIYSKIAGII